MSDEKEEEVTRQSLAQSKFRTGEKPHSELLVAQRYLERFGYLDSGAYEPEVLDEATQEGLELFQWWSAIPPTRSLDEQTIEAMQAPRCGMADPTSVLLQSRRSGRKQRGWRRDVVRYALVFAPSHVDESDARAEVESAIALWQQYLPLELRAVRPFEEKEFEIRWIRPPDGDGRLGGGWGHADFPPGSADEFFVAQVKPIHMRDDADNPEGYRWFAAEPPDQKRYSVESAVAHEVGHMLGLEHTASPDDLMFRTFDPRIGRRLPSVSDIDQLLALYEVT